jgi:hypothetical protein
MRFIVILISFVTLIAGEARASDPAANALAEKMLAALGGRAVWAETTGTINVSQQNRVAEPTVVRATITMDFTQTRFRIDTQAPDFATIRVIDGPRGWRKTRDGKIEDVPADLLADDLKWYAAHVYRSIHRIASQDTAITLRLGKDGRLEAAENGRTTIWFRLDAKGEPYAFGPGNDDTGTICGPWDFASDGLKHPIWTARPDGTWRANIVSLSRNPAFPAKSLERPGE